MSKSVVLIIWFLLLSHGALNAQNGTSGGHLTTLERLYDNDQYLRSKMDSIMNTYGYPSKQYTEYINKIRKVDGLNQIVLDEIIPFIGWPGGDSLSAKANQAIFLVIQHADLGYQLQHKPLIEKAFANGQITASQYAMFIDRLLMYQDLPQIYGTQLLYDEEISQWTLYKVDDLALVIQRRQYLGLGDLDSYLKQNNAILK